MVVLGDIQEHRIFKYSSGLTLKKAYYIYNILLVEADLKHSLDLV